MTKDDEFKKKFSIFLLFSCLLTVLYGVLQFFHFDFFHRQINPERISGFHKNAYSYAGQLIVFFFFTLNYSSKFKSVLFKSFSPALVFFCILNTSERAVILGVVVGLFVYIFLSRDKRILAICSSIVTVIPIFLSLIFHNYFFKRIGNTFFKRKKISNPRFKLWKIAIALWKKNILFGVGKFPIFTHVTPGGINSVQYLTHAHNVCLQILVTNGLVGLLAFLNLIYSFLAIAINKLKERNEAVIIISIIFAYCIEGIFEFFWGDSEVRYLILYFFGYVVSMLTTPTFITNNTKLEVNKTIT